MGIVITYTGSLDNPAQVDHLITEVQKRCQHVQWQCQVIEQHVVGEAYCFMGQEETPGPHPAVSTMTVGFGQKTIDERIRGILVYPPGCDTLTLTFKAAGQLQYYHPLPGRPFTTLGGYGMSFTQEPGCYLESAEQWVKTTGEVTAHVLIVALLRFLQQQYISNLAVQDATGFWGTFDMTMLTQEHTRMQALITLFQESDVVKDLLQLVGIADIAAFPRLPRSEELN